MSVESSVDLQLRSRQRIGSVADLFCRSLSRRISMAMFL